MIEKGFWNDVFEGKIPEGQKILEQLLHASIETLEWLTAITEYSEESTEDASMYELADVLIVLLDLCGGIGIDVDLNDIRPSSLSKRECDSLKSIKNFFDGVRKNGFFTQADIEELVKVTYCMFGKALILAYVEQKMEKNIQRPAKYGKQPFNMELHAGKT